MTTTLMFYVIKNTFKIKMFKAYLRREGVVKVNYEMRFVQRGERGRLKRNAGVNRVNLCLELFLHYLHTIIKTSRLRYKVIYNNFKRVLLMRRGK